MKKICVFVLGFIASFIFTSNTLALPIIDQTGNLLTNGNFETGEVDPWVPHHSVIYNISTEHKVDGDYGLYSDTTNDAAPGQGLCGLYQWLVPVLEKDFYTASAWFYPIQGQTRVGFSDYPGAGCIRYFSEPTTVLNRWQYLELTVKSVDDESLVSLWAINSQDKFYTDGVWLNRGQTNLSPYALQNGFIDPNIPEPATMLLFGIGGFVTALIKRRKK